MQKHARFSALGLLVLLMTGCFSVGVYSRDTVPAESHHVWLHGFLWGLVGSDIDGGQMCGGRPIARVDTYMSLGNMVLYSITGGLYSSMSVEVTCGQPRAPQQ